MVRDAYAEGKQVSICGEMAGDPAAAVLLMAMGFDSLSMNATNFAESEMDAAPDQPEPGQGAAGLG